MSKDNIGAEKSSGLTLEAEGIVVTPGPLPSSTAPSSSDPPPTSPPAPSDTHFRYAQVARLVGATFAFVAALLIFFGIVYLEWKVYVACPGDPKHEHTFVWQRGVPLITSTLFAFALLRAANALSIPIDVYQKIELSRTAPKEDGTLQGKIVDTAKVIAETVKAALSPGQGP